MFDQATLNGGPLSTRLWTTCAGVTGQALLLGCMLLAPLIWPQVLPRMQSYVSLAAPGPPPAPPPPGLNVQPRRVQRAIPFLRETGFYAPVSVPRTVTRIEEPPELGVVGVQGGVAGGVEGGTSGGLIGSVLQGAAVAPPPPRIVESAPAAARAAAPVPLQRVRMGGVVKLASPIRRIDPVYPQLARQARVEGVVELEGVVGIDGRIHELKVKSGHPLLVKAAVDAVQQWVYTPATLNGDLVEVIAPIIVTFRLGGR